MYRFDHLIENLRKYKHAFIKNITKNVAIPKQKFLKQAISAVLLSGSLVITKYAKWIRDNCKDVHHSKKRLLNQLNNNTQWQRILQNYRCSFVDKIAPDTPLIIDMTDIAKPRARKMQNGIHTEVELLCERCYQNHAVKGNNSRIIYTAVKLPQRTEMLYLVAVFSPKYERALMLLTTMKMFSLSQTMDIVARYVKRWKCEQAIAFLKGRIGFEQFSVRNYERMKHLILLAMLAMGFLCFIQLSSRVSVKGLFCFTSKFRKSISFEYYRLLDGLQHLIHQLLIEKKKPPECL